MALTNEEIRLQLTAAAIPPYASRITLESAGQATLRSIILDRSYQTKGALKSISLLQPSRGMSDKEFQVVVARFAAELCIVGQPVLYSSFYSISRELSRYAAGGDTRDSDVSVLRHQGFLCIAPVWDLSNESRMREVSDWLMEFVSLGGAVVLPVNASMSLDHLGPLLTFMESSALRIPLAPTSLPFLALGGQNV